MSVGRGYYLLLHVKINMVRFQAISILSTPVLQNVQGHDCLQLQQFLEQLLPGKGTGQM